MPYRCGFHVGRGYGFETLGVTCWYICLVDFQRRSSRGYGPASNSLFRGPVTFNRLLKYILFRAHSNRQRTAGLKEMSHTGAYERKRGAIACLACESYPPQTPR